MKTLETILKDLIDTANLDNFSINDGILYMLTDGEPSIKAYFNSEGDLDYAEVFNIKGEEICPISDIRQIWYASKSITITTDDYKIVLSNTGCNMTAF